MSATHIPVYQATLPAGGVHSQVSGLALTATAGGFTAAAVELAGIKPRPGDKLTAPDGTRHTVTAATMADGVYTLTCEPEGGA